MTFINVDHDGYPDLFVGNVFPRQDELSSPNRLFINRAGIRFREAPRFGLTEEVGARCVQAADYDNDGWQDLLVCGVKSLYLYRNDGGEVFTDVSAAVGLGGKSRSACLADVDGDGWLDLIRARRRTVSVRLQRGGSFGAPTFSVSLAAGARIALGDINQDSRLDLYLVVGCGSGSENLADVVLVNRGNADFDQVAVPGSREGCGDLAEPIDHDSNGTTDFIVVNGRGYVDGHRATGPIQLISFGP